MMIQSGMHGRSINECRSNDCRSYECRRNNCRSYDCRSNDCRSNETTPQAHYLIPMNLPRLTPDTVDVIFDTHKTDLRCDIVMFKAEIKRWTTLTTTKPSNLKDTLTSQTKSSILRSAPFC